MALERHRKKGLYDKQNALTNEELKKEIARVNQPEKVEAKSVKTKTKHE